MKTATKKPPAKEAKQDLPLDLLRPHPLNRSFAQKGEAWEEFVESVRIHGVVERLIVRPLGEEFQVVAGHRRLVAARLCQCDSVPCQILSLDDTQALVYLINSNLQRENPNIVDEARLVSALIDDMGLTAEQVAHELSRDMDWMEARQMVFQFDKDVQAALITGELSEGAFREILRAPAEIRDKATQLVLLGGGDGDEPLSAERARQFIQFSLIPEWEKQTDWEEAMEKTRKAVVRDLKKLCPGAGADLNVCVMRWGRGADGLGGDLVPAKEEVPAEYLAPALRGQGKTWVWFAEKIGTPVYVIPPDSSHHEKRLLVSRKVLLDDASARLDHGMESDLIPKERQKKDSAIERAVAALDGEGEKDYDETEPVEPVATPGAEDGKKIEQTMDHAAWTDMGVVRRLAMWAISPDADPATAPEWVPNWAREMAYEGRWTTIDEVCNWIKGLKK